MRPCVLALFLSFGCGDEKSQETGCTDASNCIDAPDADADADTDADADADADADVDADADADSDDTGPSVPYGLDERPVNAM